MVTNELDYEYCTVLNNYKLIPDCKSTSQYHIPEKYETKWMKVIEEISDYLEKIQKERR